MKILSTFKDFSKQHQTFFSDNIYVILWHHHKSYTIKILLLKILAGYVVQILKKRDRSISIQVEEKNKI